MEPNSQLLDAVRLLSKEAALSDLSEGATTEVVAAIEQVRALLNPIRARLPRKRFEAPQEARKIEGGPWVAGDFNPVVPQLPLEFSENEVTCTWTAGPLDEGPPGFLHGGLSAYILDVLSGVLVQSLGLRAVTGTLNLRYHRAVPLDEQLFMNARVERMDGRKVFVKGEIAFQGKSAIESDGLFIELLPDSHLTASALKR